MIATELLFGKDARNKLAIGANKLAQAVVSTLGPRSRNVAINREWPAPLTTHDGVTVAQSIRLEDPFEDMGAVLLREAATKTNDLAGDGTTTATLLANVLIQEGNKIMTGIGDDGIVIGQVDPMVLQQQFLAYADLIIQKLNERKKLVTERQEYESIAAISSGNDEMGKLVADAIEKVGKDGIVMVDQSDSFESSIMFQEGMQFDNGFLSHYFVTNPDHMIVEYKESYVLITDHRITDGHDLVNIIEKIAKDGGKPLLIIADDVVGHALNTLVLTKTKAKQSCVAVAAPEFADRRKQMLEDIAILTGGNVISRDLGKKLEDVTIGDLGRLRSMRITQDTTTITPSNPDSDEIKERVSAIRKQIDEETNAFKKSKLEDRLGKLTKGVAVIQVGGGSLAEMQERYKRVEDAVHATKAAIQEGIIPGAGVTLLRIAEEIREQTPESKQDAAYQLVQKMLRSPFETILKNAGFEPDEILQKIDTRTAKDKPEEKELIGFDVTDSKTHPLFAAGIIDPVKVTRLAVIHAMSVASTFLTNETLISPKVDKDVQKMEIVQR